MTAIKNGTLLVKDSNGNTARVATLSQTDITTLNTALADIEANKRKISSISTNYVTTNTAQTISKNKVFTNQEFPLTFKDTRFDNSVAPTKQLFNSIILKDKNDKNKKEIGSVYSSRFGSGDDFSIATRLQTYNPKSALNDRPYLEIKSTKKEN